MIGIHPWFVSNDWKKEFQALEKLLRDFPLRQSSGQANIGIGECGLDFSSFAKAKADRQDKIQNRADQEECFIAHLELARELNRPVAVHCVKAWGRLIDILRDHSGPAVIIHAFSGAVELIPELTDLNGWFSFCGNITKPEAVRARAAAVAVPPERLLIESDAPDFRPVGCPKPNEPANLIHVARQLAELRGVSTEEISRLTFCNSAKIL